MKETLSAHSIGLCRLNRWILREISIDLKPGSVVALVGPNGSGKSTLLRCLAGLWRTTEGQVTLGSKPLDQLSRGEVARHITYVPQEMRLEFEFSVREIVLMGRYPHRRRFERETSEDRKAADEALELCDVAHLAERPVTLLSGGERQRVLIARSLATLAPILLLDEPTASLDIDHSLDVLDLCYSLTSSGRTVVIATHDLNAVCRYVDQVALLESGRLVALGDPKAVLTDENLERTFRVRTETLVSSDGTPLLLFRRLGSGPSRVQPV
jgi:iron complex transport system ATP-binding protein